MQGQDVKHYANVFAPKIKLPRAVTPPDTINIHEVRIEEKDLVLNMKSGKVPGEDGIVTDFLKDAGENIGITIYPEKYIRSFIYK